MKRLTITGNLGKDPEIRANQEGNSFAIFPVGISVGTKQNPKTDWVEVILNEHLVDFAKNYLKKGSKILADGYPIVTAYINKENQAVPIQKLHAKVIELLVSKTENDIPANDTHSSPDHENSPGH